MNIYICKWFFFNICHSISLEYIRSNEMIFFNAYEYNWLAPVNLSLCTTFTYFTNGKQNNKITHDTKCFQKYENFINYDIIWVSPILHSSVVSILNLSIMFLIKKRNGRMDRRKQIYPKSQENMWRFSSWKTKKKKNTVLLLRCSVKEIGFVTCKLLYDNIDRPTCILIELRIQLMWTCMLTLSRHANFYPSYSKDFRGFQADIYSMF